MVRPSVHSTKHYIQQSIGTRDTTAVENVAFAQGVAVGNKNTVSEVEEGSQIKAFYFEMWLRSAATAGSSFTFIICKRPSNTGVPSQTEMAALGDWDNKKNIMFTSQGLLNDVDADAMSVHRGWVKVPKGKQRMGLNDIWSWHLNAIGQSINFCGFQTYKEYT